ncbi:InlB B-repeat-containing protein [bacterium]|nr:InlB B-repeat-containing protein [bacterium]
MKRLILISILFVLSVLSCSDESPVNPNDGAGTAVIQCTVEPAKPARADELNPTVKAEISFYDAQNTTLVKQALTVNGKHITGTVTVKSGSGYHAELFCYDADGNVTHSGTATNISITAGQQTTVTILLKPSKPETPTASGPQSAITSGTSYTVSWDTVSRAQSYTIEESTNSTFADSTSKTIVGTSDTYKNTAGTYYYRVRANNATGSSGWSNTVVVTVSRIQYTLTLAVNTAEWGTTNPSAGAHTYDEGTEVTVTAIPSEGYRFAGWTGSVMNATNATTTVTVTGNMTVVANFEKIPAGQYALTLAVNTESWGTTNPSAGVHTYDDGTEVTITATPASGCRFVSWTGDVANTTNASTTVSMNGNKTVVANFEQITLTLSGTVTGADSVTVTLSGDASGIRMVGGGGSYSFTVDYGGSYTVTPSKVGYTFSPSNFTVASLTTSQTQNFSATPIPAKTYVISGIVSGANGVTVTLSGDKTESIAVNDGSAYSFTVQEGGSYTVTPSKDGHDFAPVSKSFTNVTANQTQNFTATKRTQQYTLTLAVNTTGWGTTNPSAGAHTYDSGTVVTVTATPASGYRFVSWTGTVAGSTNTTTTVTVTGNMTVTANFEKIPKQYALTLAVNMTGWGTTSPSEVAAHMYDEETVVSITATPASGYRFVNWTGTVASSTSATTTVTVTGNITVTANFEKIPKQYALTLAVNMTGWGTTSPSEVAAHMYDEETVVSITATPASGYRFVSWTGTVASSTSASTTVTVTGNMTVTANFEKIPTTQYTLTMAVNNTEWGTTSPSAGAHTYDSGTVVTVTASPATGYRFVSWTGTVASSTSASTTVTVTGNMTVTANFEKIPQYILTIAVNNPDWGTTNPTIGWHAYDEGKVVTIKVSPVSGYRFVSWTGNVADTTSASTSVTMTGNMTVTANFEKIPTQYTLMIKVNINGWGTTNPSVGDYKYDEGAVVSITATPATGYLFTSWTGDVASSTSATTTVTMNGDRTVTANFEKRITKYTLTLSVNTTGWGTTNPSIGSHTYVENVLVTITATPAAGYRFVNWTGGVASDTSSTTTVWMNGDKAVKANFTRIQYTLTMAVNTAGWGTTSPSAGAHTYDEGTVVTVTATPSSGYRFVNWTGNVANTTSASTTATVTGNMTVTANFEKIPQSVLTMAVNTAGWGTTNPSVGEHTWEEGVIVEILAYPALGYRFVRWTGNAADTGNPITTVILSGDMTVTANFERDSSKIAFYSSGSGYSGIRVMNADGSGVSSILAYNSYRPSWSPDGTKIAFDTMPGGNLGYEVFVMNADGSGQVNLTNSGAYEYSPAWSPDGTKIAFVSDRDGRQQIYVMNTDGSGQVNLSNNNAYDSYPAWSPDGSMIAFYSQRNTGIGICVMNADGSGQHIIPGTNDSSWDSRLSWSPDGSKIAYASANNIVIYVVNVNVNLVLKNITNGSNPGDASAPSWSPDGAKIAYRTGGSSGGEIYVVNTDGSDPRNLTNSSANDGDPSWSPR